MPKMPRPCDLMDACPNPTAAILMQHIIYCSRYAKRELGGHRWFISSYRDWADNTGLSFDQVKRGLAALRKAGLIVTEQHLSYGRNVSHVRLVHQSEGGSALPERCNDTPPQECKDAPLKEVDQKKDQTEDQTQSGAAAGDNMKTELPWMQGKAKKALEVLAENDEKVKKRFSDEGLIAAMDRAEKKPSRDNLEKVYQTAWVSGGFGFLPDLSKKERGQLTELLDACASTELGVYLIVESVRNWNLLAIYLKQVMKSSQPPEKPKPGYILSAKVAVLTWVGQRAKETAAASACTTNESDVWKDF